MQRQHGAGRPAGLSSRRVLVGGSRPQPLGDGPLAHQSGRAAMRPGVQGVGRPEGAQPPCLCLLFQKTPMHVPTAQPCFCCCCCQSSAVEALLQQRTTRRHCDLVLLTRVLQPLRCHPALCCRRTSHIPSPSRQQTCSSPTQQRGCSATCAACSTWSCEGTTQPCCPTWGPGQQPCAA